MGPRQKEKKIIRSKVYDCLFFFFIGMVFAGMDGLVKGNPIMGFMGFLEGRGGQSVEAMVEGSMT